MIAVLDAARQMKTSAQAQATLHAGMTPRSAVHALLEAGHSSDALSLFARLLPRRYAVAWACQCGRQQELGEHDRTGIALAETWVRDPGDSPRAAALAFARTHRYQTIGAWTAAAAGWSGGNLNPQYEQPTPPPEHLTAIAVTAAVNYIAALVVAQFDARRTALVRNALELLGTTDGIGSGGTQ